MQVIKDCYYHITGISDVMSYQFTRLLNNRSYVNVTCDVIVQPIEICLEPTLLHLFVMFLQNLINVSLENNMFGNIGMSSI